MGRAVRGAGHGGAALGGTPQLLAGTGPRHEHPQAPTGGGTDGSQPLQALLPMKNERKGKNKKKSEIIIVIIMYNNTHRL